MQFERAAVVDELIVTLVQDALRPVEGVDMPVRDTGPVKPFIPVTMTLSVFSEPAGKITLGEFGVRLKFGGGATASDTET